MIERNLNTTTQTDSRSGFSTTSTISNSSQGPYKVYELRKVMFGTILNKLPVK